MISRSAEQTIEYARRIAKRLKGGEVIGLVGELGSGKTTFVKGLAEGLGIKEPVTSPTFVLLKEYPITHRHLHFASVNGEVSMKLMHVDAYRVGNIEDIKPVGIEDYLGRDDVIMVIEWAEKIKKILPKHTIYINFKHINESKREIIPHL